MDLAKKKKKHIMGKETRTWVTCYTSFSMIESKGVSMTKVKHKY